jgi:cell wall-associated NlpC family hydrolase
MRNFKKKIGSIMAAIVLAPSLLVATAPSASAVTVTQSLRLKAVSVAASKYGSPYQWGAVGPKRFDCSGLVLFAFRAAGKSLPRTSAMQYRATKKISASQKRVGDLVFVFTGGRVTHVAIYAGMGRWIESPRPGTTVRLAKAWSSNVKYGRVV